jgi:heat-inducible transcriptional repressor
MSDRSEPRPDRQPDGRGGPTNDRGDDAIEHLDERKAAILRAIVEQYIAHAQPVGSAAVARAEALGVSAATVRNEMSVLERDGYIAQPHTSAGRVPTDRGYRYYVDHLAGTSVLPAAERRRVADFFTTATMAIDELLGQTSHLLARVTAHAAVVVGPQVEAVTIRGVQLVGLQPRVVLVVVVLSNGAVEKETIFCDTDITDDVLAAASARLAARLTGQRLGDVVTADLGAAPEHDAAMRLAREALHALRVHVDLHQAEPLWVGGASRLASEQEAFTAATTARLLELLEQHVVLAALMRELLGPGLTVRIGSENPTEDLRECSVVLAPYLVEGEPAGTIGVLGPTRMDYRKAQAAVATISERLGRQLSGLS